MLMAEWDLLRHAEKDIYVPIQKSPKHVYIPLISVNGMDWGREIICSPLPMRRIGVSPPCNVFKMLHKANGNRKRNPLPIRVQVFRKHVK